jgi:hypothetical protein
MNLDATTIARWLNGQPVARKPTVIARYTGIPIDRVRGALTLLEAVDKAEKDAQTGCWRSK